MSDEDLLITTGLEQIVNETHERIEKAGNIPFVTSGSVPHPLRRTIFGMAWKSGVSEISLGFERDAGGGMVIMGAKVSYMHVQADRWTFKIGFERRSVRQEYVNKQGEPDVREIKGRGSEKIFVVGKDDFQGAWLSVAPRRAATGDQIPESWTDASKEIRNYSVSAERLDRLPIREECDFKHTGIDVAIAKVLCKMREFPHFREPMGVTAPAQDADFDGAVNDALMNERASISRPPGTSSPEASYQGNF